MSETTSSRLDVVLLCLHFAIAVLLILSLAEDVIANKATHVLPCLLASANIVFAIYHCRRIDRVIRAASNTNTQP